MASPERPARRELRAALLSALERLLSAVVERLDWGEAQSLGATIGRAAWRLARRDRRRTLEHLAIAFPQHSQSERTQMARASFRHLGTMLAEGLWIRSKDGAELDRRVRLEGWDEVERARAAERPIVIVTGHCGNWELLAAALNRRGLGMAVIARELDDPGLQGALVGLRERFGTRTIVRGAPGAARELLRTLRSGGALGLLIDQDTSVEGVWIDFFGRKAWTPSGAADIALRFRATVLPVFVERLADGTHAARIEPPLALPTDPVAATQTMSDRIEAQIRRVPEQWVWLHRRWRRQPPSARRRASTRIAG